MSEPKGAWIKQEVTCKDCNGPKVAWCVEGELIGLACIKCDAISNYIELQELSQ